MNKLIILGTDTNVGKTMFSAILLHHLGKRGAYWKPLETGDSDTETIRKLVPAATIHQPLMHFDEPVAPLLAAYNADRLIPSAREIATATPTVSDDQTLVIETFGSPLSPLSEFELQVELIRCLDAPVILVGSSSIGAIGRMLQCITSLSSYGMMPIRTVMLGPYDQFAANMTAIHGSVIGFCIESVADWTTDGFANAARANVEHLDQIPNHKRYVGNPDYYIHRDRDRIWHPYTPLQTKSDPLVVVEARDEFLELSSGERIIDSISSWWTILHGHSHLPLVQALHRAAATLDHVIFARTTHPNAVYLAEQLLNTMPWEGGKLFYSDNGSTAIEVALKMALQYWRLKDEPQHTLFVSFENGYHGDTFGAMSVGRDPLFFKHFEPLLFESKQIPVDPNKLDELLTTHCHRVAAIIIEPLVQGAGGMRMHSPEILTQLYEVAKRHKVLFIADEVMTGNRTGKRWAFQHSQAIPDFVCASKTLAGGMMPLAATLIAPHIVEVFNHPDAEHTFFHGHSFTGHPLACAVAVANEGLLQSGTIYQRTAEIEAYYHQELDSLREHPNVRDVRICGSIAAIELDVEGGYLADVAERIRQESLRQGVLLRPLGNVVYAMPPLGISDESLQKVVATMKSVIE